MYDDFDVATKWAMVRGELPSLSWVFGRRLVFFGLFGAANAPRFVLTTLFFVFSMWLSPSIAYFAFSRCETAIRVAKA